MNTTEVDENKIDKDMYIKNLNQAYLDLEKMWKNQKISLTLLNPDKFLELKAIIRSQETEITKLKYQIKSVLDHNEAIEKKNYELEQELKKMRFDK